MPEVKQKETVTVGGKNYIVDDLSDKSKYLLAQLQDLSQQQNSTRARLHQVEIAIQGFEKEFENSIKEESDQGTEKPPIEDEHIIQ